MSSNNNNSTIYNMNDVTQLTELEYIQAVVEKQKRLIRGKDHDLQNLLHRAQGAEAALWNSTGALRNCEAQLKAAQSEIQDLRQTLTRTQSEKENTGGQLQVTIDLLKGLWQHCVTYAISCKSPSISRQLVCNNIFRQATHLATWNDEKSLRYWRMMKSLCTDAVEDGNSTAIPISSVASSTVPGSFKNTSSTVLELDSTCDNDRKEVDSVLPVGHEQSKADRSLALDSAIPEQSKVCKDETVDAAKASHGGEKASHKDSFPARKHVMNSDMTFVAKRKVNDLGVTTATKVTTLLDTIDCTPTGSCAVQGDFGRQRLGIVTVRESKFKNVGKPMEQPFLDFCDHQGTCESAECDCFRNQAPCRPRCSCGRKCPRQFRRCECTGPCRMCNCRRLGWACIDADCSCSGCSNKYNTAPPKLAVWKSRISGGGKGLFALEPIKKGTYLGDYTGERVAVSDTTDLSSNPRVALFDISAGERKPISREDDNTSSHRNRLRNRW